MRLRRQNLPWLIVTAATLALALAALPAAAGPALAAALLGCGALALLSSLSFDVPSLSAGRLRASLPAMPLPRSQSAQPRISDAAHLATERARRHTGSDLTPGLTLLDIGLICAQLGPDGMTMRKGRSFSGDDDGLRPYISLHIPAHHAERSARLRFEISDQRGQPRFIHQQDIWLREGKRDVLSENQLPLAGNPELSRSAGEWELRVSVDAAVLGMFTFEMTPSLRQRSDELERRQAASRRPDAPPTLEELMRDPRHHD